MEELIAATGLVSSKRKVGDVAKAVTPAQKETVKAHWEKVVLEQQQGQAAMEKLFLKRKAGETNQQRMTARGWLKWKPKTD